MSSLVATPQIDHLTVLERIQLIQKLGDSIAAGAETLPLTSA